jgi:hypothetical protein
MKISRVDNRVRCDIFKVKVDLNADACRGECNEEILESNRESNEQINAFVHVL